MILFLSSSSQGFWSLLKGKIFLPSSLKNDWSILTLRGLLSSRPHWPRSTCLPRWAQLSRRTHSCRLSRARFDTTQRTSSQHMQIRSLELPLGCSGMKTPLSQTGVNCPSRSQHRHFLHVHHRCQRKNIWARSHWWVDWGVWEYLEWWRLCPHYSFWQDPGSYWLHRLSPLRFFWWSASWARGWGLLFCERATEALSCSRWDSKGSGEELVRPFLLPLTHFDLCSSESAIYCWRLTISGHCSW